VQHGKRACELEAESATEEALVDEDDEHARAEVEAEVQRGAAVHAGGVDQRKLRRDTTGGLSIP
jgi:hypothetical protein